MARRFSSPDPGAAAAAPGAVAVPASLVRTPTVRSRAESAIKVALFLAAILSVVTTLLIILSLARETISFFGDVPIQDYLFGDKWTPLLRGDQQSFGVIPLISGALAWSPSPGSRCAGVRSRESAPVFAISGAGAAGVPPETL